MSQPASIRESTNNAGGHEGRPERDTMVIARRFFRAETCLFLAIWLILLIGTCSRLIRDPGTLRHPVIEARILADRKLPHTDPFSGKSKQRCGSS